MTVGWSVSWLVCSRSGAYPAAGNIPEAETITNPDKVMFCRVWPELDSMARSQLWIFAIFAGDLPDFLPDAMI